MVGAEQQWFSALGVDSLSESCSPQVGSGLTLCWGRAVSAAVKRMSPLWVSQSVNESSRGDALGCSGARGLRHLLLLDWLREVMMNPGGSG